VVTIRSVYLFLVYLFIQRAINTTNYSVNIKRVFYRIRNAIFFSKFCGIIAQLLTTRKPSATRSNSPASRITYSWEVYFVEIARNFIPDPAREVSLKNTATDHYSNQLVNKNPGDENNNQADGGVSDKFFTFGIKTFKSAGDHNLQAAPDGVGDDKNKGKLNTE